MTAIDDFRTALQSAMQRAAAGDIPGAEADYARAIELADDDPKPHMMRAQFLMEQERYDQAIADYTAAINMQPQNPFLYVARAKAYTEIGDLDSAVADCTTVLEISDRHPADTYHRRAQLYMQQGDLDAAIADFSAAIEHSRSYRHYVERAKVYEHASQHALASADWQQVIALCRPDDPEVALAQSRLAALQTNSR
jgi:tetratricopeptide (TPR) repeat protein